jgi:hypothetical protein
VKATDRKTGEQASTKITLSAGLTDGELGRIVEERRTDRVETAILNSKSDASALEASSDFGDLEEDANDAAGAVDGAELTAVGAEELISALGDRSTESDASYEIEFEDPPDLELVDEELLPEPDDPPEFDWTHDEELIDIPEEPPDPGQVTAVDEDLEATDPTFDEFDEADSDDDLFEKPGTDLSDNGTDSKPRS